MEKSEILASVTDQLYQRSCSYSGIAKTFLSPKTKYLRRQVCSFPDQALEARAAREAAVLTALLQCQNAGGDVWKSSFHTTKILGSKLHCTNALLPSGKAVPALTAEEANELHNLIFLSSKCPYHGSRMPQKNVPDQTHTPTPMLAAPCPSSPDHPNSHAELHKSHTTHKPFP